MQNVPDQQRLTQRLRTELVSRDGSATADPDKMLSLLAWTQQPGREAHSREPDAERDWSGALNLLHQAAEAIRANADQSKKVEARVRGWLALATQEIERAQARIEDLEARLQVSDARANAAEAHVKQTEEWLQRAHDTIATELSAGMRLLERSEVTSAKRSEGG